MKVHSDLPQRLVLTVGRFVHPTLGVCSEMEFYLSIGTDCSWAEWVLLVPPRNGPLRDSFHLRVCQTKDEFPDHSTRRFSEVPLVKYCVC